MPPRLTLLVVTLFWVTMNVLLWRSEFGASKHVGSPLPSAVVWQKILTAPDNSSLEILHHGVKIGYCRWSAAVGQNGAASKLILSDAAPDGLMERPISYRIDFEGTVMLDQPTNRLRFDLSVQFDTNHVWQEFRVRLNMRPAAVELYARAAEEVIHVHLDGEEGRIERTIKTADLLNPQALARELDLPAALPLGTLWTFGLPRANNSKTQMSLGLAWEARNDWVTIAHTSVRAYRLQAPLLDRYRVVVMVSRVGEILRVELPDDLAFVNEQLSSL